MPSDTPGFGKTILLSLLTLALAPATIAVLWAAGQVTTHVGRLTTDLGITWGQVGIGAATLVGYALIIGIIHTVRTTRARTARCENAIQKMARP